MVYEGCVFSPDRRYRYVLWRRLGKDPYDAAMTPSTLFVQWIGLNPSVADETKDDPTVRRCIDFTKRWGFSAMCMTNAFAFRATDPREMKAQEEPVGVENTDWLCRVAQEAAMVVCCWGNHGQHQKRSALIIERFKKLRIGKLYHLGLTEIGEPRHPLYLSKTIKPIPWEI